MNLYQFGGKNKEGKAGGAVKVAVDPGLEIIPNGSGLRLRLSLEREVEIAKEASDKVTALYDKTLKEVCRDRDELRQKVQVLDGENAALSLSLNEQGRAFWNGLFWGVVLSAAGYLGIYLLGWGR